MNLLAPAGLALGVLIPVIVAFYLLKLRRTEREVSSTYLWRKMVRDVEANAPWQKLKPNLLLLLQLLFLAALILAIARPFSPGVDRVGQTAILILDSSASMSATDVQPTRLDAAKTRAAQIVDEMPENGRVTVIEAGSTARLLVASTQDRRLAHQAIEQIQPGTGGAALGLALELASAVASRQPDTDIIVLSDGRGSLPQQLSLHGRLRYIPIGLSGENLAISQLNLEYPAGGGLQAFIQVTNTGRLAVQRRIDVLADGQVVSVQDLDVPVGASQAVVAADLPSTAGVIQARLEGSDLLAADDRAEAVVRRPQAVKTALVSNGNIFLRTILGLLPNVELTEVKPGDTLPAESYDLYIYDRNIPAALPAQGALWFIAPPKSSPFFQVTGQVDAPRVRAVDPEDALLRNTTLDGINVLDSVAVSLPDWATVAVAGDLADGSSVPLLLYGESGGRRVSVLAFELGHSDFGLNVAFPITLANTISWLVPASGGALPAALQPGEPLVVALPAGVTSAALTRPDGKTVSVQAADGRAVFSDTAQLGVYRVAWQGEAPVPFAVNLFSAAESSLMPLDNLPGVATGPDQGRGSAEVGKQEWWRWIAGLALLVLVVEWLVYQRAALRKVWDRATARIKG
jgi:Ca-activated chloride channel homolog